MCPVCRRPMVEAPLPVDGGQVAVDVCASCQFLWFDAREFEQVPRQAREPSERESLPEKAREQIALMQIKSVKERAEAKESDEAPDEVWKWIPAALGMPVEMDVPAVRCWPWLTWGIAALLALVFAATCSNLEQVVREFGLIPAELWRHGGITLLSNFFLHAGLMHLICNVYFLLIFGDNVEDDLGPWRFLLLLVTATLVGNLAHLLGEPHNTIPAIGASGGISGVIVYYAIRFPHARLGFMFRWWTFFRWCYLPAYAALILWLLLQFLLAAEQLAGVGEVSALAHLGGAAVGVGAWLLWRKPWVADG